jgi:chromosomal replication initiator protein
MLRNLLPLTPSRPASDGLENGSLGTDSESDFLVGSPYRESDHSSPEKTPVYLVDDSQWFLVATLQTILTGSQHGPFTLVGPTGSGKTTLTTAIVAAWQELRSQALHEHPTGKPVVTTGADFARSYAHAVEADAIDDFRRRHRRAGLVVIDDLQGLAHKPAAQQELRTMLDRLALRGVTVVCTSSVPPLRDADLSPDLASRLAGGQVAAIAPPSDAVCVALMHYYVRQSQLSLDESAKSELTRFLAQRKPRLSPVAIRNAIGALAVKASHAGKTYASSDIRAHFDDRNIPTITPREIALAVGKWMNVKWDDLKGPSREQSVVRARGLAMSLIRELTGQSLCAIGELFGDRDHTTVMNACQRITQLLETDHTMQSARATLLEQLRHAPSRHPATNGHASSKAVGKPKKPRLRAPESVVSKNPVPDQES